MGKGSGGSGGARNRGGAGGRSASGTTGAYKAKRQVNTGVNVSKSLIGDANAMVRNAVSDIVVSANLGMGKATRAELELEAVNSVRSALEGRFYDSPGPLAGWKKFKGGKTVSLGGKSYSASSVKNAINSAINAGVAEGKKQGVSFDG